MLFGRNVVPLRMCSSIFPTCGSLVGIAVPPHHAGRKALLQCRSPLYVVPVAAKAPANLTESRVDLSGWTFALDRKEELQSLFADAWRLERDFFYDPGMHGVDWKAMRTKYAPLASRVTDRSELNDVVAQMVGAFERAMEEGEGGWHRRSVWARHCA